MSAAVRPARGRNRLPRNARVWVAGAVACALVATVAVIASGYDARETPREEPGVWVAREAGQYARVNTETGELDLVRRVADPSGVVQAGGRGAVLTNGNGRAWALDPAAPVDLGESADEEATGADGDGTARTVGAAGAGAEAGAVRLPEGTRQVASAGRFVAVRTEAGDVYVGELAAGEAERAPGGTAGGDPGSAVRDLSARLASLTRVDPLADGEGDEDARRYAAAALALTASGRLATYSSEEDTVRVYDVARGAFVGGPSDVPAEAGDAEAPQLATVDGRWVLLDPDAGTLWREGAGAAELELGGSPRLQASDDGGDGAVLVADTLGLVRVPQGGDPERIVEAAGAPAQPTPLPGATRAAWVGQGAGLLWSSDAGETPLELDDEARDLGDLEPVFRSNGDRAVLSEARTGMVWTLPDGDLIPLSQWTISDPPKEDRGTVVVEEVTEQLPPTAVDDAFGVRAGETAPLPVLLNDFDPNKRDVLTVVPESLSEQALPEDFGTLSLMPDGQSLAVRAAPGASGSATFRYRVTDGALSSEPATVTLTIAGDGTNTAPEWCPVEGCQREWGVPAVAPGGTLVYPVLEGWVDPEGDVMTLVAAAPLRAEDPVRAIVTADGRLAVRHTDPGGGASEVGVRLTVRDGRGAERQRELQVAVAPDAPPEVLPSAATIRVGETAAIRPLDRVAGGSGSYALVDAAVQGGGPVSATARASAGVLELSAAESGGATVTLTVRDTVTGAEATGQLRVTATPAGAPLALPPLRAFVRPLVDTTVEVLDAIPGAGSRPLAVTEARVADGELQADVIDHARVRVAGGTADGAAGRIGGVDVTVAEGEARAEGRLTVFQVPDAGSSGAVAVADTATVRAGSVVDIRVLDNDLAGPGERLALHPEIVGSGARGELAFASGTVLRYLAPERPGTYRLSYTAYGVSDPTASDVGAVIVTVLPPGENRDPQPAALTARVSAGATTEVRVPVSGIDPDGDRARLVAVEPGADAGLATAVGPDGERISVSAAAGAAPGVTRLAYSVRDALGGSGRGTLTVIVMPPEEAGGAPVASTDSLRLTPAGRAAVVRPLDNDVDPAGGRLSILSVEPNVAGGPGSAEYRRLAGRLDLGGLRQGRVSIAPGDELGTVSYRYTVRSSASRSTADGLIVVQTSERVGAQAPSVTDTILNVRDRADLADGGVDVVTDKVRWATGDPADLTLSLWEGGPDGYRAEGTRISGEYRPEGDTVVFRLSGTDASGARVASYGLLVVPPLDELRLTLKPGVRPVSVDEDRQAEADVRDLVDAGPRDRVELRRAAFPVGRSQASCEAVSAERLRYVAGREGPWADTCLIQARLVGQEQWTSLAVPVTIVPKAPAVELRALTRTVAPGTAERVPLSDMVTWSGGREGDAGRLRFEVSGGAERFEVRRSGASLEVRARADAVPGSAETLSVEVRGAGESRAPLTLRVGQAPRDLPRGATVALRCTVGADCRARVVGAAGEHDPFAGRSGGGLALVSVDGGSCAFGAFSRASDTDVAVSWPDSRGIGGTCTVGYTVRDAQGRTGDGTIEFDAQGLPRAPSIQQTGYDATSASFTVTLGSPQAHPGVSGVDLAGGGARSCAPAGPATFHCVASGLAPGEKHRFTARAVNAVGQSDPSTAVTAWAYAAPAAPEVRVEPIANPRNLDQTTGGVRLHVRGSSDTRSFSVAAPGQDGGTIDGPSGSRDYLGLAAGPVTFTVTPVTRFEVPPIGGSATGAAATADGVVIGAPVLGAVSLVSTGDTSARASYDGSGAHAQERVDAAYSIAEGRGEPPSCFSGGQADPAFQGLRKYRVHTAMVCLRSDYGMSSGTASEFIGPELRAPTVTYTVSGSAAPTSDGGALYDLARNADGSAALEVQGQLPDTVLRFSNTGGGFEPPATLDPISVRQCTGEGEGAVCSDASTVRWRNAPTVVSVVPEPGACLPPGDTPPTQEQLRALFAISPAAAGSASFEAAPPAAGVTTVTVRWGGPFAGLEPATLLVNVCPAP